MNTQTGDTLFVETIRQDEERIDRLQSALDRAHEMKWRHVEADATTRGHQATADDLGVSRQAVSQMIKRLRGRKGRRANKRQALK